MNKFECMVQAHEYEQRTHGEKDLDEFQGFFFKIGSSQRIAWLGLLRQERSAHLSKRKWWLSVIFVTGMASSSQLSSMLTSTGDLSVCETQCARLSEEFGFQHISLKHLLGKKSQEQSCRWAEFLTDCLKEEVNVPVDLVISLLESKIKEGIEKRGWSLVCGFPKSMEQLLEFERKVSINLYLKEPCLYEQVQKPNYTLLLNCSTKEDPQNVTSSGQSCGIDNEPHICKARSADLETYLRSMKGYSKEVSRR